MHTSATVTNLRRASTSPAAAVTLRSRLGLLTQASVVAPAGGLLGVRLTAADSCSPQQQLAGPSSSGGTGSGRGDQLPAAGPALDGVISSRRRDRLQAG